MLISSNCLKGLKINAMFYLLQTVRSVTKIDGLLTLDVHNISVPIGRCSVHTLRFKGEWSSWKILLRGWLANEQFSFVLMFDASLSSRRSSCPWIKVQSHFSWAIHGEGLNFSSDGDLMKVFKDAHVKFQAERVANVYMLRNSKVIVGGLWLSSASRLDVVEQSETTMVSSSEV